MATGVATTTASTVGVLEQVVEARRRAGCREARGRRGERAPRSRRRSSVEPGELVEVPGEVRAPEPEPGDPTDGRASELPYAAVRGCRSARRVSEVDHEPGPVGEAVVVDPGVRGDDGDAVGALERAVERRRREPVLGQLGHVRVVVGDVGALVPQELDQLQRRRLPQVADVRLVGDADEVDACCP